MRLRDERNLVAYIAQYACVVSTGLSIASPGHHHLIGGGEASEIPSFNHGLAGWLVLAKSLFNFQQRVDFAVGVELGEAYFSSSGGTPSIINYAKMTNVFRDSVL